MRGVILLAGLVVPGNSSAELARHESTVSAALDSILVNPNVHWRSSSLSSTIRHRVHLTARKIPPFPHENPSLMDPHKWPNTAVIEGAPCSLRVVTTEYAGIWDARGLSGEKAKPNYSHFYTSLRNDMRSYKHGPEYTWRGNGALMERLWCGGDSLRHDTLEYLYYSSGELFRFISRREQSDPRTGSIDQVESLEEIFASDGNLIGCEFRTHGVVTVSYWMGEEVGYRVYRNEAIKAQLSALR